MKLKNCPFCESSSVVLESLIGGKAFVVCTDCHACGPVQRGGNQKVRAVEAWNSVGEPKITEAERCQRIVHDMTAESKDTILWTLLMIRDRETPRDVRFKLESSIKEFLKEK